MRKADSYKTAANILTATAMAVGLNAAEPDLRVGFLTDTHIGETETSCRPSRKAFELFKKLHVDMVVHMGDLADRHYPEGYKIYRRYFDEVFGDSKPKEIYIYACHDRNGIRTGEGFDSDMLKFKKALNIENAPCDRLVMKGYPFLIYPDYPEYPLDKRMPAEVREMIEAHPGKPVFVLDHVPPYDTTASTRTWGSLFRRRVFDQFPQVIHISGHIHNTLRNELCIWQGKFTAVNAGGLTPWAGPLVGCIPPKKERDEVLVMEVFPRKILFRRYSIVDDSEIRPEKPWCVPWPFDPENAPYAMAFRKAHSPAPEFPEGSKITVAAKGEPFREMEFSFPEARHPEGCYHYNILIEKKTPSEQYEIVTQKEEFGQFHLRETERTPVNKTSFNSGIFAPNENYRITVIPQNFYGSSGSPLRQEFKTGIPARGITVFESADPMQSCVYMTELTGGTVLKPEDGLFPYPGGNTRLVLPKEVWYGPKGTPFRFVIDLVVDQPDNSNWTLVLRSAATGKNAHIRIFTPSGKTPHFRLSVDIEKKTDDDSFFLLLREGLPGKIAFRYVRIEQLK